MRPQGKFNSWCVHDIEPNSLADDTLSLFSPSRCTKQAQSFNDQVQAIRKEYGAEVVGISGQDVASKEKFATDLSLNFSILADEGDATRKAFDVPRAAFGLLPGRVTYVLDKAGVCQKVHNDLADAASHVEVAKEALASIKPAKKSFALF